MGVSNRSASERGACERSECRASVSRSEAQVTGGCALARRTCHDSYLVGVAGNRVEPEVLYDNKLSKKG
jgi:hypothetical protein